MADNWDEVFDVVVAGTGAGGLSTAVICANRGARVLVVEKADSVGGTTKKAAAFMWIPNNHFMQQGELDDPRDGALRYMARLARPASYDPDHETLGLDPWEYEGIAAHFDSASLAIKELVSIGAVDISHAGAFPDFYSHLPEDEAPFGRTVFPTAGEGGPRGGQVLVDELHAAARRAGVDIRLGTPLKDLVRTEDGTVVGAVLGGSHDGVRVGATRGVVAATGSFAQNAELRSKFLDKPYLGTCSALTNTGDFLELSRKVGADFTNMNLAMQAPVLVERLHRESAEDFRASFILGGDGLIVVDTAGLRVCSETASYHEFGDAFFEWNEHSATYTSKPLIAIWDHEVALNYGVDALGNPVAEMGVDDYWVIKGDSLAELETNIASRLEHLSSVLGDTELDPSFSTTLNDTIKRFAGFAQTGVDEDFGRGSTPSQLALGGFFRTGTGVNPTMRALSEHGPYYAAILGPGLFETVGGAVTDVHGRLRRADNTIIDGIYGVGTCVAGPWGEAAWSGGHNIGYALVSAYRVAQHLMENTPTTPTTL